MNRSMKQQVYLYQVTLFKFYYSIYLPNLQSFETGYDSFYETTSLSLSSNSIKFYFSIYLPNLQSFETGDRSFYEIKMLSLSSKITNSPLVSIFLNYNHSKQDIIHSQKQQVYLYQVEYSYSYLCRCSFHKWRIYFHVI